MVSHAPRRSTRLSAKADTETSDTLSTDDAQKPPPRKRAKRNVAKTSNGVANGGNPSRAPPRVAHPDATNAPLIAPEISQVLTTKPVNELPSPSFAAVLEATTTDSILSKALAHLTTIDARMAPLIAQHHCRIFSPEGLAEKIDPFESLVSGIISQQVSGAAAKAIKARFIAHFVSSSSTGLADTVPAPAPRFPPPSSVAACRVDALRAVGLSQRKAEYLIGLAEKFASGELTAEWLFAAPYDEVLVKLTAVRGLGQWSVEMFACFALKRLDVFSLGDLGVQRGMAAFVGRDVAALKTAGKGKWKYMPEREMRELSDRFRPYRSVFMWYMWRVEETDVSTLE